MNDEVLDKINELEYKIEELERELFKNEKDNETIEKEIIEKINRIITYEDKIKNFIKVNETQDSSKIIKIEEDVKKITNSINAVMAKIQEINISANNDKLIIQKNISSVVDELQNNLIKVFEEQKNKIVESSKIVKDEIESMLNDFTSDTSSNEETKISSDEIKEIANIVKISIDTNYKNEIKKEVSNLKEKKSITTKFIIPIFINIMVSICVLTSYNYFFNDIKIIKKK